MATVLNSVVAGVTKSLSLATDAERLDLVQLTK